MKIVVTGGRNFSDGARIEADLRALLPLGLTRVAQGGNGINEQFGGDRWPAKVRSADALAWLATQKLKLGEATYWTNREVNDFRVWTGADGKWPAAGPRRNIRMLEAERPELVLAYPDMKSRGTWQCVRYALSRGAIVVVWAADFSLWDPGSEGNFRLSMRLPQTVILFNSPGSARWLMWPTPELERRARHLLEALGGAA